MSVKRRRRVIRGYGYGLGGYYLGGGRDDDEERDDLTMSSTLSEQFDGIDVGGEGGGGE